MLFCMRQAWAPNAKCKGLSRATTQWCHSTTLASLHNSPNCGGCFCGEVAHPLSSLRTQHPGIGARQTLRDLHHPKNFLMGTAKTFHENIFGYTLVNDEAWTHYAHQSALARRTSYLAGWP